MKMGLRVILKSSSCEESSVLAFVRSLEGLLNREASTYVCVDDPQMKQNPHQNISKNIILYKAPCPEKTSAGVACIALFGGRDGSGIPTL